MNLIGRIEAVVTTPFEKSKLSKTKRATGKKARIPHLLLYSRAYSHSE
ncbi:MAG: hypothetical protein ACI883_001335 [Candidatus Azotimanducaceae bacterium]